MRYNPINRPPCMNNNPHQNPRYMQGMNGAMIGNMNDTVSQYPVTCPYGTKKHMIQPNETLYSLAIKYNTTVDLILYNNPQITNPNIIYAGEYLCIPINIECSGFFYTIKPNETLYSIAMSFSMTVDELLMNNPHIDPRYYQAGEVLCIPQDYPCAGMNTTYTVQSDDTLYSILDNCNVSLNSLMSANPDFDPNNIIPGTKLCVIPSPCTPMCDNSCIIPDCIDNIEELAQKTNTTPDEILKMNPNYPPCYFIAGHPYCKP